MPGGPIAADNSDGPTSASSADGPRMVTIPIRGPGRARDASLRCGPGGEPSPSPSRPVDQLQPRERLLAQTEP